MTPAPGEGASERFYYQLVIRIFKGRMFPPTHDDGGRQIALEARFNGENLATDPVALCSEPTFNTELVWEFGAAKHKEIREREGATLRLQCVLAGEEMCQTGAKMIGFVMLDLRSFACTTVVPIITPATGRHGAAVAANERESKWYQLRGARQPLPEVKIFVKINCKPVVSLLSGPLVARDFGADLPERVKHGDIKPRGSPIKAKQRASAREGGRGNVNVGMHGTVLLPPQRRPASTKRELGEWGRYALVVQCKSVTQEQVGVSSMVPLDGSWSLLLGIAGRMYAIHAPKMPAIPLAPGHSAPEPGYVNEVLIAEASSLADFLERSDSRGGGIALWLFGGGKQLACGTVGLGQLAGAVGRSWKEGQIGSMATSAQLFNSWVPSRMDDICSSGPGADAERAANIASIAFVDLHIDLVGIGSEPEPPVPVPEFEQHVPCSLAITIVSLCLVNDGEPLGVDNVKILCRKGSVRGLGEDDSTALHSTQPVRLRDDVSVEGHEGKQIGIGEMFTIAGGWADLRGVVLEFDLTTADHVSSSQLQRPERLLGAGMVDLGAVICCDHSKDDLSGVAGAMRVRTVALVDQRGQSLGRVSIMLACNLSLDFPHSDAETEGGGLLAVCAFLVLICIYIRIDMYIYMNIHICMDIHIYIYVCIYVCIYLHLHIHIYICIYKYLYICIYICIQI